MKHPNMTGKIPRRCKQGRTDHRKIPCWNRPVLDPVQIRQRLLVAPGEGHLLQDHGHSSQSGYALRRTAPALEGLSRCRGRRPELGREAPKGRQRPADPARNRAGGAQAGNCPKVKEPTGGPRRIEMVHGTGKAAHGTAEPTRRSSTEWMGRRAGAGRRQKPRVKSGKPPMKFLITRLHIRSMIDVD